jgi:hypothetical protein
VLELGTTAARVEHARVAAHVEQAAVWSVDRRARIVHIDPVINVVPRSSRPQSAARKLVWLPAELSSPDRGRG